MGKSKKIHVKGSEITILAHNEIDYISLTDMTGGFQRRKWPNRKMDYQQKHP